MSSLETYEDLKVWQEAHALVLMTYSYSQGFPVEERYGITSQLRRAMASVPANIVEGFKRRGKPDKIRFYNIAQASLEEARYFSRLSRDLGFHEAYDEHNALSESIGRMLTGLIRSIETSVVREVPAVTYGSSNLEGTTNTPHLPPTTYHLP